MARSVEQRTDPRGALLHPAFLAAVVLLVVNDHVLKGSGLLPAAVTGKLSDVAGLVVAPVAVGALTGVRGELGRRVLVGVVGVAFAITELSQSSADALAHLLASLGVVRARLVADPTDLWALAVLPLPYALLGAGRAPASRVAPRVSLGVALLACVASPSPPPPSWNAFAYLVNRTGAAVDVRVAWTAASPDCAALASALPAGITLSRVVDPAIFGDAITFHLDPGATVPIDETNARAAVGTTRFGGDAGGRDAGARGMRACELVLLRTEGAPDRVVLVSTSSSFRVGTHVDDPPTPARAVQLRQDAGIASWSVGADLPSADTTAENAPSTCHSDRAPMAFSGLAGRTGTLGAVDVGADGCLDARLDTPSGASHLFLCGIPASMLPFTVGDTIGVASADAGHLRVATLGSAVARTLTIEGPVAPSGIGGGVAITTTTPESCNGERLGCGAFVVPLGFTISGARPGEDPSSLVVRDDATGHTELLVGATEEVLLAAPGCSAGRDQPGTHTQLALAFTPP